MLKNLKFRYAAAKNFVCFGPEGIELFFEDYGNIILVKGLNLDTGTEIEPASNGSGKSTLQDIISYTLYGKMVKRPKQLDHATIINANTKKKLETEVQFDDYRIVRNREPNKLRLWKSADHIWDDTTEITKGTMSDTQEEIERIIGLTHTAFCNIFVFDDSNFYCFLEQDTANKRVFVENLLALDKYREFQDNAKELLKEQKNIIKELTKEYERSIVEIELCQGRISKITQQESAWRSSRTQEITQLESKLTQKQTELASTDSGDLLAKYQTAQDKIAEINLRIPDIEEKKSKIVEALKEAKSKYDIAKANRDELQEKIRTYNSNIRTHNSDLSKSTTLLNQLKKLDEGQQCPTCHGVISKQNYGNVITHEENVVESITTKISQEKSLLTEENTKLEQRNTLIKQLEEYIDAAERKRTLADSKLTEDRTHLATLSKVQRPDVASKEQVLEAAIMEIKQQLKQKQEEAAGESPYKEILISAETEIETAKSSKELRTKTLQAAEEEVPYYEYWVEAFGDKGIRKYIIDGIIPRLNERVAYWMQYLSGSKIQLSFDNELNDVITRNGTESKYHAMSNGEKRKINLAVSQAFAYVMTLNSGSCPSLVFLDEITGGGIDKSGVVGVYNMIFELAKERQIFVTSHNQILLDMLSGCESLLLIKQNDITKLSCL